MIVAVMVSCMAVISVMCVGICVLCVTASKREMPPVKSRKARAAEAEQERIQKAEIDNFMRYNGMQMPDPKEVK